MRSFLATAAVAAVLLVPGSAAAQGTKVGPYIAYHDDAKLGVGGFVTFAMPSISSDLSLGVDVGAFFPDDGPTVDNEYFEVNVDGFYDVSVEGWSVAPFLMGGLRIGRWSVDSEGVADGSSTDLALNAGAGIKFATRSSVQPIAGLKIEIGDASAFVLFGRLAFGFGGNQPS